MYVSLEPVGLVAARQEVILLRTQGIVEACLTSAASATLPFNPKAACLSIPAGRPGRVDGSTLGEMGEIHPMCQRALDMAEPCFLAAFSLDALLTVSKSVSSEPVPKFMPVERDLAVVVPLSTPAGDVLSAVRETANGLSSVTLFDVYQKHRARKGTRAGYAAHIPATDRTLTKRICRR
jgi:phenylalanyl-tRNA synthetase beta chain